MTALPNPCFWFSQVLDGQPEPWRHFDIDGILVNSYEIVRDKRAYDEIRRNKIHKYLRFDGPIMMDSGGYSFMKRHEVDISADEIIDLYETAKPNYGVILDHPITPHLSRYENRKRRLLTLNNTSRMMQLRVTSNPEIIPVIHGFHAISTSWFLRELKKIHDFKTYGIGSLVPSVFNAKGIGGISNVIRIILGIRKLVPDARLHVFGIGSITTMNLIFYAGANSVDSSSWRTKAAFGAIQLPGLGDRYITGKAGRKTHKNYRNLSSQERKLVSDCNCPACRKEGLEGLTRSFELRALHNAWVFQEEVKKIRKLKRSREYESYARELIGKSIFRKNLSIVDKWREGN